MENFARRGIRSTVAVAGLAALGVGLAAPTAFALPGVPDIGGVGNTQTAPSPGAPSNFGGAAGALGAPPERFQFTPPAAAPADAAPSASSAPSAEPAADDSTESETTAADDTETTEQDPESTSGSTSDSTSEPAEAAPVTTPSRGLLPSIPGSPVAAQASPQVSGVDPSSALQSLDSGSMF